jgi:hypothetical protein
MVHTKTIFQISLTFIFLGALSVTQAKGVTSVFSTDVLKEITDAVESAERPMISNLKVESEVWIETRASLSDPCEPWNRTPICVLATAWFDGLVGGKARYDVHRQVLEWQNGAAEYIEESYSVGFDGQQGRLVRFTTGPIGKVLPVEEGVVFKDSPRRLGTDLLRTCTGAQFSLQFFFANEEEPRPPIMQCKVMHSSLR